MKTLKKLAALALCLTAVFALAGCEKVGGGDPLILGTSADYPPYEFHILEDGEDKIVGFDVALAYQIAEDMGRELVIKDMGFDFLMEELNNGTIDMVIACIAPTEKRLEVSDFSDLYREDPAPMMVIRAADAEKYTSIESMAGTTIGVQTATTKADLVKEAMPDSQFLELTAVPDLINNLLSGKCEGVFLDGGVALDYVATNPDLVVVEGIAIGEGDKLGVAVQKGDPEGLLESINKTIAECKENGKLDEWYAEAQEQSALAAE